MSEVDEKWMRHAIELAAKAEKLGEVPVGAVVVLNEELIGEGFNSSIMNNDPCAHAEVVALRNAASKVSNYRLNHSTLYVTLEPCVMCTGAIVHARIARLVYGAADPKTGVIASCDHLLQRPYLNHQVSVTGGLLKEDCGEQLSAFFRARRAAGK